MKIRLLADQYIAYGKSLGAKFKSAAYTLRAFCRFVGDEADIKRVREDQVNAFLAGGEGQSIARWQQKYGTLRVFYDYAISSGCVATAPLPAKRPKCTKSLEAYIYSVEELKKILRENGSHGRKFKLEPLTIHSLLLLLYGTGLRIGEALALTYGDVDISTKLITVSDTKFFKTRLVPVGQQLHGALERYVESRRQAGHSQNVDSPFFVTRSGASPTLALVERAFRRLCIRAGVTRSDGSRLQPRLHDLRHTFAVHRLIAWYREGANNVQNLVPHLATYLGHVHLSSTQVYLKMTPELLQQASLRFEQYAIAMKEDFHE